MTDPSPDLENPIPAIQAHYTNLHDRCDQILKASLQPANLKKVSLSHHLVEEMDSWCSLLESKREVTLLKMANQEYQYALLSLVQGHYRPAFKALRLVLELTLQCVYLSANEIDLREWLANKKDTVWAALTDKDSGVFSPKFSNAFFPELKDHMAYHKSLACQVYRECSECVHGNVPFMIPLPGTLEFSQETFDLWHAKSSIISLLFNFILCSRYITDFSLDKIEPLEDTIISRLGHIQDIRKMLGGAIGG